MCKLALLLLASSALAQDVSRSFQLKNNASPTGLQEIATTLRTVFDIKQLSIDSAVETITITGNSDQIALTEWLMPKLDVLPGSVNAPQKYFYAGDSNNVVEVVALKNAAITINLQEMLTSLRTVADIQRIYQSTAPRMLIWRADANHAALAEFLVGQLDVPASPRSTPTIQTTHIDDPKFDSVLVYGLAHTTNGQELQTILTNLRTVLQIQKIYQQSGAMLLAVRGDATQIQMAEWLLPKLDTATPVLADNQMQVPGGKDDVVRVFYLPPGANPGTLMQTVRTTAKIPVLYQNINPPALVVRSTADQVAMAGRLIGAN